MRSTCITLLVLVS